MGSSQTKGKNSSPSEKAVESLKNKVRLLQGEINEIMVMRETENEVYERELMVFAFKQSEWRRERKRLRDQVKRMKRGFEEKREEIVNNKKDEAALRDVTVEKWKKLYFAIKVELDDLIERTRQEQRLCWNTEEEMILMQLNKELKRKEEKIQLLQAQLTSMEDQQIKREREIDILRQSLRIMSHRKKAATNRKTSHPRKDLTF